MSRNRGFSLIELLIVLTLMMVVFAITVPTLNNCLTDQQLEAASLQLQQEIRSLGQQAFAEESDAYQIKLNVKHDKYKIINQQGNEREVDLPRGVDLVKTNYRDKNYGNDVIRFSARGIPTGGHIILESEQTGKLKYVIVAAVTGRTRVSHNPPTE